MRNLLFRKPHLDSKKFERSAVKRAIDKLAGFPMWGSRPYMTKAQALEYLKRKTDEDFGYDVKAWRRWYKNKYQR